MADAIVIKLGDPSLDRPRQQEDEMSASPDTTPITVQRPGASTASISARETGEIQAANASGKVPVVFVHGLWLLPSSRPA